MTKKEEKIFYHYTDVNGILGILKNKTIRLTGSNNLNDPEEIEYGKKILNSELEISKKFNEDEINEIMENVKKYTSQLFICSFTSLKDEITQWIPYANNGTGVAIGFKESYFSEMHNSEIGFAPPREGKRYLHDNNFRFSQVIYNEEEQRKEIKSILENENTNNLSIDLSILLIKFKSSHYKHEEEYRLTYKPLVKYGDYSDEYYISIARKHNCGYGTSTKAQFFVSNNKKIITYYEFDLEFSGYNYAGNSKKKFEEIFKEIILGPCCDISNEDLKLLLAHQVFYIPTIKSSDVKYRGTK